MDKLATAFALEDRSLQREHFRASENTTLGLLRLQTFHRKPGAVENLAERLGIALPGPGETRAEQGAQWFWSAPGEWIVAIPLGTEREVLTSLEQKLDGLFTAVSVVTDSRVVLELSGSGAREVLSRGSTVDFHPAAFSGGQCLLTRFAGVPAMLVCRDGGESFLMLAERSVALYLMDWLEAASVDC